jgi:hypothetical protein
VLVNFGTYTCINWLRSLPYVRAWADKYASRGLVVVGVQTPEYEFEGDLGNVGRAIDERHILYPVVVDNDYAVWRAFDNHYWPALYFVDAEGRIRHHHFGEGEYEESEMVLQMLLREAGADIDQGLVDLEPDGVEAAADWASLGSPETYVGYGRATGFASPGGFVPDERHAYSAPSGLRRNQWSLSGDWLVGVEPARLSPPGGSISYGFHARDLHLVMGPPAGRAGALHRPPRRRTTRARPWHRRRRERQRHRRLPADVPVDPPAAADRRPAVRDRVPRRRRRGLRVHIRMTKERGPCPSQRHRHR